MPKTTHCKLLIFAFLVFFPAISQAAPRLWKNTNATRSFRGELIKREADKITISMLPSRKSVVVKPDQLHADDLKWLKENHPLEHEKPAVADLPAPQGSFLDTLAFGDNRTTVIKKLKASKRFHSGLDATYFARTGMNGTFRTTKGHEFFGMPAALYFGWDDQGGLKFLDFYGGGIAAAQSESQLVPDWQALVAALNKHYGKSKSTATKLPYQSLAESEITFTHAWPMEPGGSLLLGAGKQEGEYVIIARFTSQQH